MLKIGEVSRILNLPVKTIRYWEEFGLFKPSYVDEYTGYRQFSEKDVARLSQIVYLKSLGFELKEIKNFDDKVIAEKTKKLKAEIYRVRQNIRTLSSLQKDEKGEYIMKNFVNDENAIGHWKLLGLADTEDEAKKLQLRQNHDFKINDLYLMENGLEYWVISWTKGAIFIKQRRNPYEIVGNKMIVALSYDNEVGCYAVYERVDNKKHEIEDFAHVDRIDLPFKNDEKAVGIWKSFDFIKNPKKFDPCKKELCGDKLFIKQMSIMPNGEVIFDFDEGLYKVNWTKGIILYNIRKKDIGCAMHYSTVVKDNTSYLIMEWKSGDYTYGGFISGYYVFKKEA